MKLTSKIKSFFLISLMLFFPISYAANAVLESDVAIVSSINQKISADTTTSDLKVRITSQNGIVTLSGNINTDDEADKLVELAQSTDGVRDVKTRYLYVKKSQQPMSDSYITAKVKGMYLQKKLFSDKDISMSGVSVITTNGIVYLTGTVKTRAEADNAVKYAKLVNGVRSVNSKLEIQPTE